MFAVIDHGRIWDLFETDPHLPDPFTVIDVSGMPDIKRGWVKSGEQWVDPATLAPPPTVDELVAYAALARYARETGGVTVAGAEISTDRDSQSMVANAYALLQASGAATVNFKAKSGWVTLTADQLKAIAVAVGTFVQACFTVESETDAKIRAEPPTVTTYAEVDAAFAAIAG